MAKKTIAFYNDAQTFGGHEVMSAHMANDLSSRHKVIFYHAQQELRHHLNSSIQSILLPFQSSIGTLSILKNLNARDIAWTRRQFNASNPDVVCIVQGAVDLCLRGAIGARMQKYLVVSYLPMAFPRHVMGLSYGFLDLYSRLYFRIYNAFITINSCQKYFINEYFKTKSPVFILENCVSSTHPGNRAIKLNSPEVLRLGFVGRLEWTQKGLSQLLEIVALLKTRGTSFRCFVFGDGPDRHKFEQEILRRKLVDCFELKGWEHDSRAIYQAFDILIMPSLFEGVPMVMLEALAQGIPILGRLTSGTQVFKEYLPEFCMYTEASEAAEIIFEHRKFSQRFSKCADGLREFIATRHGHMTFSSRVLSIFDQLLERGANAMADQLSGQP